MADSLFDLLNSLEDIDHLIASGHRESETVEYKTASQPLRNNQHAELAKDLSAFANSAGGVVIYGVATDGHDRTRPTHRVPIDPSIIDVAMQVAATHIRHPVPGIRWKTLPVGGRPEILLCEVPQSSLSPHQVAVRDYRYYRRHGALSEPMTHDLLELYFGRRLGPILEPQFHVDQLQRTPENTIVVTRLRCRALNIGQRVARDAMFIATASSMPDFSFEIGRRFGTVFTNTELGVVTFGAYFKDVIHPSLAMSFFECTITAAGRIASGELPLFYFGFHADQMAPVAGRLFLRHGADGALALAVEEEDISNASLSSDTR